MFIGKEKVEMANFMSEYMSEIATVCIVIGLYIGYLDLKKKQKR